MRRAALAARDIDLTRESSITAGGRGEQMFVHRTYHKRSILSGLKFACCRDVRDRGAKVCVEFGRTVVEGSWMWRVRKDGTCF